MSSSSSFGSWYDEKRESENGDAGSSSNSSSWFSMGIDSEQVLPLFNSESLQGFSFDSMKQSMESQMPKKIMGMGYQQRFKVILVVYFPIYIYIYILSISLAYG